MLLLNTYSKNNLLSKYLKAGPIFSHTRSLGYLLSNKYLTINIVNFKYLDIKNITNTCKRLYIFTTLVYIYILSQSSKSEH